MTTPASATSPPMPAISRPAPVRRAVSDAAALAWRVLLYYRHSPGLMAVSLIAPVAMLVLFGYVFGSAIRVPGGGNYREYLMPGLFVLTAFNGVMPSMVGAARDIGRGMTDRLRSMPISRPAALVGQALADLAVSTVVQVVMVGVGLVAGWRIHDGFARAVGAIGLLLLFRFVMTWIGVYLGLLAGREDIAGQLGVLVFPVGMITNVFVPTAGMPAWLRVIADWNPISAAAAACRDLFANAAPATAGAPWPLQHPVIATLGWSAVLLGMFAPLAVRRFSTHGR